MTASPTGRHIVRTAFDLDWSRFEGMAALRCTVGVAVPLLAGIAIGQPAVSAFGTVGAVSVGFGSFQGAYRSRAAVMLWAALGMAAAIVAGSLAGHDPAWSVAVAATFAFTAGLLVALGPAAAFVGLQSVVAVLVASGFPTSLSGAATRAGLVFAGGVAQTLLVVLLWPLRRFAAERAALADVYRSLSTYARGMNSGALAAPEPHTLAGMNAPSADPQPFARAGDVLVFQALFDEAERIRASLAALATRFDRDERGNDRCTTTLTNHVAGVLSEIAASLEEGRGPSSTSVDWAALDECARTLRQPEAAEAVLGQLRTAWRLTTAPAAVAAQAAARVPPLSVRPAISDALTTVSANLTPRSAPFRHALRLAVTVGVGTALYRSLGLSRGYWIPMTALLVLKPEFSDTFSRGLARVAGTVAGALLATAIVHAGPAGTGLLTMLVLSSVWACYAVFRINYALFAVFLTAYVVFILMLGGAPEMPTASARAIYTLSGGVLAAVAYAAWPTWAGASAPSALAAMMDAHRDYLDALLDAFSTERVDPARLAALRAAGRLARSNAEATVERMFTEPRSRATLPYSAGVGVLAALRRNALAALALHAALERGGVARDPALIPLKAAIHDAFGIIARALREGTPPHDLPPLRRVERDAADGRADPLRTELDLIVDSVDTLAELLGAGPPR
jgi:hypothetical protein